MVLVLLVISSQIQNRTTTEIFGYLSVIGHAYNCFFPIVLWIHGFLHVYKVIPLDPFTSDVMSIYRAIMAQRLIQRSQSLLSI